MKLYSSRIDSEPIAMAVEEALQLLGPKAISRASFYAALRRGEVPCRRLGKRYIIPRRAFLHWFEGADHQPMEGADARRAEQE